jgi:para-nitrobenzyl esterase
MTLRNALAGAALLLTTALVTPLSAQIVERPIRPLQTTGGLLAGQVLPSGVKAWFGVPYAKPPTQGLRWKPPEPISWNGVWNADRIMPECIQVLRPHNINHYFGEEPTSENCLYANIWAPPTATANSKLPVIVFIYGGGSTVGSSGMASYGGEQVARRGAVYVNFNYRLGILGFMAHPELTREQGGASGNYAYLDQNAALKWIQANIARFGGDPTKVIIMGQSAGAGAVIQQTYSPMSKGLFRGAVMSSGCNWGNTGGTTLAQAEQTGLDIQRRLGAANLEEMRYVPADRILGIQQESQLGVSVQGVRVGGIIDGRFMPKSQMAILQAGEINDVPIIASFNQDEASNALAQAKTVAEYRNMAYRMYGEKAPEFLRLYPVNNDAEVVTMARKAAREAGLENNARKCATLAAQYTKSPAYITTFARKHPYTPGVKIADQDTATIGAYHTADIPYYFGTLDAFNIFRPTRNWTAWDREMSAKMTDSLIAFANTGDPTTKDVAWPAWKAGDERKVVFGDDIRVVPLNTEGLAFLAANQPMPVVQPPAPARVGPRD